MVARLDAGGILDEITADDRSIAVRFDRCPAGWQATFELTHPEVHDLAVVHRLVAPTLADAKAAVPNAVKFLVGTPIDEPLLD